MIAWSPASSIVSGITTLGLPLDQLFKWFWRYGQRYVACLAWAPWQQQCRLFSKLTSTKPCSGFGTSGRMTTPFYCNSHSFLAVGLHNLVLQMWNMWPVQGLMKQTSGLTPSNTPYLPQSPVSQQQCTLHATVEVCNTEQQAKALSKFIHDYRECFGLLPIVFAALPDTIINLLSITTAHPLTSPVVDLVRPSLSDTPTTQVTELHRSEHVVNQVLQ